MIIPLFCFGGLQYGPMTSGYPLFWTKHHEKCCFWIRVFIDYPTLSWICRDLVWHLIMLFVTTRRTPTWLGNTKPYCSNRWLYADPYISTWLGNLGHLKKLWLIVERLFSKNHIKLFILDKKCLLCCFPFNWAHKSFQYRFVFNFRAWCQSLRFFTGLWLTDVCKL